MLVSLVTQKRIYSLTLPEKANGRYGIYSEDDGVGQEYPFLIVEAIENRWIMRSAAHARLVTGGKKDQSGQGQVELRAPLVCGAKLTEDGSDAIVLVEPLTEDRKVFRKYVVKDGVTMRVGRGEANDISYRLSMVSDHHATFTYKDGVWHVKDESSTNGTFVNSQRLSGKAVQLKSGDSVWIAGLSIIVGSNFVACNNPDGLVVCNERMLRPFVSEGGKAGSCYDDFEAKEPDYFYRSPRFCRAIDDFSLKIDAPPTKKEPNDQPILYTVGPSLTMGMAMVFSASVMLYNTMVNGSSILTSLPMIVMAITMLIGMVLWPILSRRYRNRKMAKEEAKRQARYREYLDGLRTTISEEVTEQAAIITENNPTVIACMNRAIDRDRSLWERSLDHADFMAVRIGKGTLPLNAKIEFPPDHFSVEEDDLKDALHMLEHEPRDVENVPISLDLKKEKMNGVIGERCFVMPFVRGLLAQLATLHSYDELKVCFVFDAAEHEEWDYARWLPHCWSDDMRQRYFAMNMEEMRELALFLEPLIATRAEASGLTSQKQNYDKRYLIVAANRDLIEKTEVLDLLSSCENDVGVNAILLFDELHNLPKECDSVVSVDGEKVRVYNQHDTSGKAIELEGDIAVTVDQISRTAIVLANTKLNLTSQRFTLPNVLPFLQMYGAGKVEHLNAATRWKENNPTVSLAVPVGVGANGDPFVLDLHEKIHGPHGLVAGMTGSGKSEFVLTYVLSLALNFHPDEVAFVLIDYKGGGLAGAFDNEHVRLPHLAGTITNLDGASIDRTLVSIQSELRHRQAVFNRACEEANEGTIDIYKYQQMYRMGTVSEPLPHLFIISDEFAELKQQQPDFMDQLISTARIGRSLGVHLILATQKPNGVVNDQIRSNSKFKVCLKVQDRADSMDMINRPDAASLVETGRFYLQVGFNEYFAQGQSAWAGASYNPTDKLVESKDNAVSVVNHLGRSVMQAKPSQDGGSKRTQKKQIVAIVDYIAKTAAEEGARTRELWLPPIPADIYVDDLEEKYGWHVPDGSFEACIGELDDPANQSQRLLTVPFGTKGNAIVCGAAGSGKNQLIVALLYSLIKTYDASRLNVYVMDFGSGLLTAFRSASQVGDVVVADETEKTVNLFKLLLRELDARKKMFAKQGSSLEFGTGEIPNIVVVIENIAVFYELYEPLEEHMTKLAREGIKYGIYFVVSEQASNEMRYRLSQNFGQVFALRLNDESDYVSLLGGGVRNKRFANTQGRGLVKLESVFEFQAAHPFSQANTLQKQAAGESESDMLSAFCARQAEENRFAPAKPVPILPEEVTPEFVLGRDPSLSRFPVGVSKSSLDVLRVDLAKNAAFVVSSNDWDSLVEFELGYLDVLAKVDGRGQITVVDPLDRFNGLSVPEGVALLSGQDACQAFVLGAAAADANEIEGRCIVLNSFAMMLSAMSTSDQTTAKNFVERAVKGSEARFMVIDTSSSFGMARFDPWMQACSACACGVWIGDGVADQQIVKVGRVSNELYAGVEAGFGYVIRKGKPVLAKLLCRKIEEADEDEDQ